MKAGSSYLAINQQYSVRAAIWHVAKCHFAGVGIGVDLVKAIALWVKDKPMYEVELIPGNSMLELQTLEYVLWCIKESLESVLFRSTEYVVFTFGDSWAGSRRDPFNILIEVSWSVARDLRKSWAAIGIRCLLYVRGQYPGKLKQRN